MSVTPYVFFSFDLPFSGAFFTLDDPVKGVLDNVDYTLSGDVPQNLTGYVRSVSISRGRQSEFDEFRAGTATIRFNNHLRTFDPDYAAGPFFGNITRGKQVRIVSSGGVVLFSGIVDDWDFDYDVSGESVATAICVDGLSTLAGVNFNAWTGTLGDTAGERVTAVLDRPEVVWPASRDIGAGVSTFTNDAIADGVNVLGYLQTVARAEVGRIFDSRQGLITLRDRHYVPLHLASSVVLADDGTGVKFMQVARREGKDTVRNWVKVTLTTGGTEEAFDADSIAANGTSTLFLDNIPLEDATQASNLAAFLAGAYSNPTTRLAQVTVKVHSITTVLADQLCALDLSDPLAVTFTPNSLGTPLEQTCVVEGIEHQFLPLQHEIIVHLSRAEQASLFILDDATYGVLDGPGLLAF